MIKIKLFGGLGNQMFQYAFGRKLAIIRNEKLVIDISEYKNSKKRNFNLNSFSIIYFKIISDYNFININSLKIIYFICQKIRINLFSIYFELKSFNYDLKVYKTKKHLFYGYWQTYLYFDDIKDLLLKEFSIKRALSFKNSIYLQRIIASESVSIHIRRGDYVNDAKANYYHGTCSLDYYKKAINYFCKVYESPVFFIFSDDIKWVKDNLVDKLNIFYYIEGNDQSPEVDIYLISKCKHNIIANSSFSWWGAYLNENIKKIVIYPEKWLSNLRTPDSLVPPEWININKII